MSSNSTATCGFKIARSLLRGQTPERLSAVLAISQDFK